MRFFSDNTFRVAVIFVVVFCFLPFLFSDKSQGYEDTSALVVASRAVDATTNPLAKVYNRIGSFYGFKKTKKASDLDKLNSMVKPEVVQTAKAADKTKKAQAASKATDNISAAAPSRDVDEYVQVGDKTYDVVTDLAGSKYALTEYGPIELDKIISQYIPQGDRQLLKQYAAGSRSADVVDVHNRYSNKGYLNNDGNFVFKSPVTNGRGGNPSMFGGENGASGGYYGGGRGGGIVGRGGLAGGDESVAGASRDRLAKGFDKAIERKAAVSQKSSAVGGARGTRPNFVPQTSAPKTKEEERATSRLPLPAEPIVASFKEVRTEVKQADFMSTNEDSVSKTATNKFMSAADTPAGKKMTEDLLAGEACKDGPCKNNDAWPIPDQLTGEPFVSLVKAMPDFLVEKTLEEGSRSDRAYLDLKEKIASNPSLPVTNIVMLDGYQGEDLKYVAADKFPAQVVQSIWGAKGKYVQDSKTAEHLLKTNNNVVVYVPNSSSASLLNQEGYYSVEFESYAITPNVLNKLYDGTGKAVARRTEEEGKAVGNEAKNMIAAIKAQDGMQAQTFLK